MIPQEEVDEQLQLLRTYRRTLANLLRQQAAIGESFCPPALLSGISEARSHIHRIKSALRAGGVTVTDDIDDEEPPVMVVPGLRRRSQIGPLALVIVAGLLLAFGLALGRFGPPLLASLQQPPAPEVTPIAAAAQALDSLTTVEELEPLLLKANIPISRPEELDRTRSYFTGPESSYHKLAVVSLRVVGDRRFRRPVYLDLVDKWYTQAVGSGYGQRGPLDEAEVRLALLKAHNDYYGDGASSLDALLE